LFIFFILLLNQILVFIYFHFYLIFKLSSANIKLHFDLYKYRYFYIETIVNDVLTIKLKISNKYFKKSDFILQKVLLYTNLKDNCDVTKYFKNQNINKISRSTIKELYESDKCGFLNTLKMIKKLDLQVLKFEKLTNQS
jgi:hypothetical protein